MQRSVQLSPKKVGHPSSYPRQSTLYTCPVTHSSFHPLIPNVFTYTFFIVRKVYQKSNSCYTHISNNLSPLSCISATPCLPSIPSITSFSTMPFRSSSFPTDTFLPKLRTYSKFIPKSFYLLVSFLTD